MTGIGFVAIARCWTPSIDVSGFTATDADLPSERTDVPLARRERAALLLLAVGRGYAPEDLAEGLPADVLKTFGDGLERAEPLAHVGILLGVPAPRMELQS